LGLNETPFGALFFMLPFEFYGVVGERELGEGKVSQPSQKVGNGESSRDSPDIFASKCE